MTDMMARGANWLGNPRLLGAVLIGSMALNLMFVGSMMGQKLRPAPALLPPGIAARLAQDATAPIVKELSEEKRARMRAIFEASRGRNRTLWQAVRERRNEVSKLLEAEPFDQAAYVSGMTGLIEAEAKARTAAQPTFAEVAAVLSPKERRDFLATHRQLRQQLIAPLRDGRRERPAEGSGAGGGRN